MRILIEEYPYEVADVKDILHGMDALVNVEGRVYIHYVGYYYNTLLKDCVFILPKVLLKGKPGKELAFGKYMPEDIVNLEEQNPLNSEERNFLYKFAVWIYLFAGFGQCSPIRNREPAVTPGTEETLLSE